MAFAIKDIVSDRLDDILQYYIHYTHPNVFPNGFSGNDCSENGNIYYPQKFHTFVRGNRILYTFLMWTFDHLSPMIMQLLIWTMNPSGFLSTNLGNHYLTPKMLSLLLRSLHLGSTSPC